MKIDPASVVQSLADIEAIPTILETVCRTTGMGFAAIARVTDEQWIACAVRDDLGFGLKPGGELNLETTICNEIRQHHQPVVIDEVAADTTYASHHTPKHYGLQSYISYPVVLSDGSFFGTLCAIDPKPHILSTPAITGMFKLFADLIAFHLEASSRIAVSEAKLQLERETADFREQFIAILGHDLRNPLASLSAGVDYLQRRAPDEKTQFVTTQMRDSITRMSRMISDLLDFARGRLGGGIELAPLAQVAVKPIVEQIVSELRSAHPDRRIRVDALEAMIPCDPGRFGQLISNLVGNALTHGDPAGEVRVNARLDGDAFELSVANAGAPIPPDQIGRLFQPFRRAKQGEPQAGLGLGLFIASEIARAHGGTLSATSNAEETRFTFSLPLERPGQKTRQADRP